MTENSPVSQLQLCSYIPVSLHDDAKGTIFWYFMFHFCIFKLLMNEVKKLSDFNSNVNSNQSYALWFLQSN
jgi:hypothetical protein